MKCPKCGADMHVDEHRRYALNMCYECGYIEGRMNESEVGETNYKHMQKLSPGEMGAFLANGLGVDRAKVNAFLDARFKEQ